jgi:molecular chaperone GrpE
LRSVADYRNVQERTKRETQNARDFALSSVMKDVLAALDNFEHALAAIPAEKLAAPSADATIESMHSDIKGFHEGVQLTERSLLDTLAKHGLTKFDPAQEKEKFDPNRHNALFTSPMEGLDNGIAFHTQQKGYELNGRVIRVSRIQS